MKHADWKDFKELESFLMRAIPPTVQANCMPHLKEKMVPRSTHLFYLKWLRYYLDFCEKYHFPPAQGSSLAHFLHKQQEKKQSPGQQQQARHGSRSITNSFTQQRTMVFFTLFRKGSPRSTSRRS